MSVWDVLKRVLRLSGKGVLYLSGLAYTGALAAFLYLQYLPGHFTGNWFINKLLIALDLLLIVVTHWLMIKLCYDYFFYGRIYHLAYYLKRRLGTDLPPILLVEGSVIVFLSLLGLWAKSESYDSDIITLWLVLWVVTWTYNSFFIINQLLERSYGWKQWKFCKPFRNLLWLCLYYWGVFYSLVFPLQAARALMSWLDLGELAGDVMVCLFSAHAFVVLTLLLVYLYRRQVVEIHA